MVVEFRSGIVDSVRHTAVFNQRLVCPFVHFACRAQIERSALCFRMRFRICHRLTLRHHTAQQTRGNDRGEVDASRTEVARFVWLWFVNGLPFPEHAASQTALGIGIAAVVAHLFRSVIHAAETFFSQGEGALVTKCLPGFGKGDGPPHDVIVDKPSCVDVAIVKIEVCILSDIALHQAQDVFAGLAVALGVALFLRTLAGRQRHLVEMCLAPDGCRTVPTVHRTLAAHEVLVYILCGVQISLVEGIIRRPVILLGGGNILCRQITGTKRKYKGQ